MAGLTISKFIRVDPASLVEQDVADDESLLVGPPELLTKLRPRMGIVVARWDRAQQLGWTSRFGIVTSLAAGGARLRWAAADTAYHPNPSGRRYWEQAQPFFGFAKEVAERYMLASAFAEQFPNNIVFEPLAAQSPKVAQVRPSSSPTGGYVYLVRSKYGIKIGKSVNVKSRTKLFEVKLPFPITVEHYAWFDDYSMAERELHKKYHSQRLEGEWFDLSEADVAHIKTLGKSVS